jgi:hypothetical protein
MLFTVLWQLILPSLILLLFTMVRRIFLVFLLLVLVVTLFISFICHGTKLGVQLEMALNCVEGGGHRHNLFILWGFGSPESLRFKSVKLAICRVHEGLMGDGGKIAFEVILVLTADVGLEVVAGNHKISL